MRINFPKIENELLRNLSEFSDVTLGYNQNKEVVSYREGNSKLHRLFSEYIYTHDISYICQYFLVSSSALWSVGSLKVIFFWYHQNAEYSCGFHFGSSENYSSLYLIRN